ncbi:helix-turn-helix domain-containing protein [Nitrincola sp.]|uniref:helix-turn-helix domain-containing protein n=1 Tax=Nitrincola sp. TaxID=1926584 RepID=UPI003A8F1BC8
MSNTNFSTNFNQSLAAQRDRLLKHIAMTGHVSTIEARNNLNILHPAGRIQELRESGHVILLTWEWQNDHEGRPHKIGRYHYMGVRACFRKRLAEGMA